MSDPHFEVYLDARSEWRWHLFAGDGKIIADSAEGYLNKFDCLHGIHLIRGVSQAPIEYRSSIEKIAEIMGRPSAPQPFG